MMRGGGNMREITVKDMIDRLERFPDADVPLRIVLDDGERGYVIADMDTLRIRWEYGLAVIIGVDVRRDIDDTI